METHRRFRSCLCIMFSKDDDMTQRIQEVRAYLFQNVELPSTFLPPLIPCAKSLKMYLDEHTAELETLTAIFEQHVSAE